MSNLTAIDPSVITVKNNQLTTTSNNVASIFSKRHTHVLEKIENLDCSPDFMSANFSAHVENIKAGAVSRDSKYYEMTKDGFMFLVMGFTGKKAAQMKEAYINAFNQMQNELVSKANKLPEQPKTLTSEQCLHIRSRVGEMVHAFKDTNFQIQYGKINREFNKNSYKDILAINYPKVCQFLNCRPKAQLEEQVHEAVKQLPNMQSMPFLNERIMFTWENGVLVDSRPMQANEMTTTKERILKLVTYHDFTTVDERLALIVALNADIAENMNDLSKALVRERKAYRTYVAKSGAA